MSHNVLTEELLDEIASTDPERWLILATHPHYSGYWKVQALDPNYILDFGELIGPHRVVSPAELPALFEISEDKAYQIAFEHDPLSILEAYEHLNDVPEVTINSHFENTINGLLPYQVQGYNALKDVEGAAALWTTGSGKAQPLDSQILTPFGWKQMGDLVVDDLVIDGNGEPTRVTGLFPRGVQDVYEVELRDGSKTRCTRDHIWLTSKGDVITLGQMLEHGICHSRGDSKWYLPRVKPVRFQEGNLPLDPYLLGALLGDGCLTSSTIKFYSAELIEFLRPLLPEGMDMIQESADQFRITSGSSGNNKETVLVRELRGLGLAGHGAADKFVPDLYKFASVESRLALIQGFCDTDGSAKKTQSVPFTISYVLACDIRDIVKSLGGRATLLHRAAKPVVYVMGKKTRQREGWTISMTLPASMDYFRLPRKRNKRVPLTRINLQNHAIVGVKRIGRASVQCISVDSPDHTYVTDDYIVTHNTVLATALVKYHFLKGHSEACFWLCKANNKVNTQRWLKQLGDLDSIVIEGTKPQREKRYLEFYDALDEGRHPIAITNYEKFRDDFCWFEKSKKDEWMPRLHEWCEPIFNSDLFLIWDEAPTKLKTRSSKLYKGVCRSLYRTNAPAVDWSQRRSPGLRQLVLTATPVEIDPEDWFNVERLINGGRTYGTVTAFRDRYAAGYDYFDPTKVTAWRDLDDIALRASGIVHRVDKSHPDIAKQFPKVVQEVMEIDWEHNDYMAYQKVMKELRKELEESEEPSVTILAVIGIGQMLCDAPEMVLNSAAVRETWDALGMDGPSEGSATALALCKSLAGYRLTNKNHTKISTLRELLTIRHPTEKCLVYTIYNKALLPMMSDWLYDWGINHVVYTGTNAQKQEAEDRFKTDPSIRVFLSSDAGSDSLNLEVAPVGINYDLPWNYSRYMQRIGRNERATSNFDTVYWYDLLMTHSVEMRRQKLNLKKQGYHEGLTGRASSESQSARMTRDELLSIIS